MIAGGPLDILWEMPEPGMLSVRVTRPAYRRILRVLRTGAGLTAAIQLALEKSGVRAASREASRSRTASAFVALGSEKTTPTPRVAGDGASIVLVIALISTSCRGDWTNRRALIGQVSSGEAGAPAMGTTPTGVQ